MQAAIYCSECPFFWAVDSLTLLQQGSLIKMSLRTALNKAISWRA